MAEVFRVYLARGYFCPPTIYTSLSWILGVFGLDGNLDISNPYSHSKYI